VPPAHGCPQTGPPSPEVTEAFCRVPSTQFSQAPWYALPVHLCRFRVRSDGGLFPGTAKLPPQSDKGRQSSQSVTSSWLRNIHLIPIAYASRPRLRGRLTLLRLALSRNPWTSGEGVSHPLYRYSCQHSRFRMLHDPSQDRFTAGTRFRPALARPGQVGTDPQTERSATTPCGVRSFGSWLEPRYIFAAGQLD
jgi:hypothetical protein